MDKVQPGRIRDGIYEFLRDNDTADGATLAEIARYLDESLSRAVSRSSVRSYLNLNTPGQFERVRRGRYRLRSAAHV